MSIAFDTNCLSRPAARRLYASWREIRGGATLVLPTVADEMTDGLLIQWENPPHSLDAALKRPLPQTAARVRKRALAHQWTWVKHLVSKEGPYQLVRLSDETDAVAYEVLSNLTLECFPTLNDSEEIPSHRDAKILAEALAIGADLLITTNMKSMDHWQINDWIKRNHNRFGLAPKRLVRSGDQALLTSHADASSSRDLLVLGIAACWRMDAQPQDVEETHQRLQNYVKALEGCRLYETRLRLWNLFTASHNPECAIREAHQFVSRSRVLSAEQDRLCAADAFAP